MTEKKWISSSHWFSHCRILFRRVSSKTQIFTKRRSSAPWNWFYWIFHHFWSPSKLLRTFFLCYNVLLFTHGFLICFLGACSSAIVGRIIFLINYGHAYFRIVHLGKVGWPALLCFYVVLKLYLGQTGSRQNKARSWIGGLACFLYKHVNSIIKI